MEAEQKVPLNIERQLPETEPYCWYPFRYTEDTVKRCNHMVSDRNLQEEYAKWRCGINYNTNKKIQIGGKLHKSLGRKFKINDSCLWGGARRYYNYYDYFDNIYGKLTPNYVEETKEIYKKIDIKNNDIIKHNCLIYELKDKVKQLRSSDEYVLFEGKKYGKPL